MDNFDGTINHGRKGIAYDWQSLCDPETLATLQELDRELDLELAATSAAE